MLKEYVGEEGSFSYDDEEFDFMDFNFGNKELSMHCEHKLYYIGTETDGSKIRIPEGIIDCSCMFATKELQTPPRIPNSVKVCDFMFALCKDLRKAPQLPDGMRQCNFMFFDCELLEEPAKLPQSIGQANCAGMYNGCMNLFTLFGTLIDNPVKLSNIV